MQHTKQGAAHVPLSDVQATHATQYTSQQAHFFSPEAQRDMKKHGCAVLANVLPRGPETETEHESKKSQPAPYAVIVLGAGVGPWLEPLWTGATVRICADGGANHVYDKLSKDARQRFLPDAIVGNMQKIREETLQYYQQQPSVKLVKDVDASHTDATKCCMYVRDMLSTGEAFSRLDSIICYGAFGGRLDHELGNLDTLVRLTAHVPEHVSRVVMLSEGNLAEYLTPGYHLIECCPSLEGIGTRCGLFPLGTPVKQCHTMGLKYNLDGESLSFGELISVSNQICAQQVRIQVSEGVIWTTECEAVYPTGHEQGSRAKSRRMQQEQRSGTEKPTGTGTDIAKSRHIPMPDPKQQIAQAYHA